MTRYNVQIRIDIRSGADRWMETDESFTSRKRAIEFAEEFNGWIPAKRAKIVDDDGEVVWDSKRESQYF